MALTDARTSARAAATRPADTITSITVICPLRPDVDPDAARDQLSRLPVGVHSPFATSPRTHFARLQILDELCTDERRPLAAPVLVLSADVDGDAPSYLHELATEAAPTLASVLAGCVDAPADAAAPDFATASVRYLLDRLLPVGLQYANSPGRTADDVHRAVGRHLHLRRFVMAHQDDDPAARRQAFVDAFGHSGDGA